MPPLAGSSSLPTLPGARGKPRTPLALPPGSQPGEIITLLETENARLRVNVATEKAKFGTAFLKDFKSPSRRRIEPMKKLLFEQSQFTSELVTKRSVKQCQCDAVIERVSTDEEVQARRLQDVLQLQEQLEYLEESLAEADADASEACDREDTYTMMEDRLRSLVADDHARINEIQRVIDESVVRLNQWYAVSKEGEAELASVEAQLTALRAKLKYERHRQRKMMSERKTMVESMVQYTADRSARMQQHKDRLLAARGDLDEKQEEQLAVAAGTIDALRVMNEASTRNQLSFEDKCKAAFQQIENLTGAADISEVLHLVTSKAELTAQLQQRVDALQQRIVDLERERGDTEEALTEEMYGSSNDAAIKAQLDETRVTSNAAAGALSDSSKRMNEALSLLQNMRLAWENIAHMLEPGREHVPASGHHRSSGLGLHREGSTAQGTPSSRRGGGSAADDEGAAAALGMLPLEIAEMPQLVDEVEKRAQRVLTLTARHEERMEKRQASASVMVGGVGGGGGSGEGRQSPTPSASAPASSGSPAGMRSPSVATPAAAPPLTSGKSRRSLRDREGASVGAAPAPVDYNVRVMPPEMLDAMLNAEADEPKVKMPGAKAKAAAGGGGEAAFGKDDDEDPLTRDDLKGVSVRLARKAARRQQGGAPAKGK
jgi:hypothetical protein